MLIVNPFATATSPAGRDALAHTLSAHFHLDVELTTHRGHAFELAARAAAELTAQGQLVSVAGGGDTVAALNKAGAADDFTFISTAGGAFLEWMEGKTLPGVAALEG